MILVGKTKALGIDLGSASVMIYADGKGVILREPSVVALDRNSGRVLQVGENARNLMGRTPGNVVAMHPLENGVISDREMTVKLLQTLIETTGKTGLYTPKPKVVMCVPSGITEVEENTVVNAAVEAGARRVYLVEAPLAAGLGAGLNVQGDKGVMVVDVGAGTVDIGVMAMSNVAASSCAKTGGAAIDDAICRYLSRTYGLTVGTDVAEDIKIQIGRVYPREDDLSMQVLGREYATGKPKQITVTAQELEPIMQGFAKNVANEIMYLIRDISPQLAADVAESGITLTGGASQLWGLDRFISERTGIACTVADDPASCAVVGCGKSLAWMNSMDEGPINIARKRLLRK